MSGNIKLNLRKPPAYQCYASDWIASEPYRLATIGERGLLFSMLNQCWVSGSVPEVPDLLARILGLDPDEVRRNLTGAVKQYFRSDSDGRLFCPELKGQMEDLLAKREERSRSGKKGAEALHGKRDRDDSSAMAQPARSAMSPVELSRVKVSREETSKVEPNRKESLVEAPGELSETARGWVSEYDQTEAIDAIAYRKASNGS